MRLFDLHILFLVNDKEVSDGEKGCERAVLLVQCLIDNDSEVSKILQKNNITTNSFFSGRLQVRANFGFGDFFLLPKL